MKKFLRMVVIMGILFFAEDSIAEKRVGIGLGIPYGGLGTNCEVDINNHLSFTGGIGYALADVGWSVGVRMYLSNPDKSLRWRVGWLRGTAFIIEDKDRWLNIPGNYDYRIGWALTIGYKWKYSEKKSFDIDIVYPMLGSKWEKEWLKEIHEAEEIGLPVKISFGWGWH